MRKKPFQRLRSLFPLWPPLIGLLAGICVADHFGTHWLISISGIGLLTAAIFRSLPVSLMVAGIILGHLTHGLVIDRQNTWLDTVQSENSRMYSRLSGVVIDTGSHQDGPYLINVSQAKNLPGTGRILLSLASNNQSPLQYGDKIEAEGLLEPIPPMRNPYGFDRAQWLHRQGTDLTLTAYHPVTITGSSLIRQPIRIMSEWRLVLRQKMTAGLAPDSQEARLIRAVVLGERPPRRSAMIDDFRNSGTLHVFAVSGLHVGMVGMLLGALLWFLRAPRWFLISCIILGMAIYAGITGLRPPAVRAVIMATLFLSAFLIKRRPSLINSLAASAIIVLLWDGHQLFTPGFQLSYGVLLALALCSGFWMRLLRPLAKIDSFLPSLLLTPWQERVFNAKNWLKNSLAVSLAAWTGSAPLMWIHFGIITPIAIIAGIPLMLMVFLILALTMLSLMLGSVFSPAGKTINHTNAIVAHATYRTANIFAHIPGSHWHRQPHHPQKGRIIVFDIPSGGGANLIDVGGGILLDCGRSDQFYRYVLPTLSALRISPDSLIVSHADSNHSGGMSDCLQHFHPKQAIIPRKDLLSQSYRRFLSKAQPNHCRLVVPHAGQRFPIEPDVFLEILHAPAELKGKGLSDNTGLVIRLHWYGWRILFMGDAGLITETRLLDAGIDLSADVIITGRNRDDFTGSYAFYKAVSPKAIISSNCHFPEYERIPQHWFATTQSLGIATFDQLKSGAVTLTIKDNSLVLTPTLKSSQALVIHR